METVVNGMQGARSGEELSRNDKVLTTAKHFVGDGGTEYGSSTSGPYTIDQGVTKVTRHDLEAVHLAPFTEAVRRGAGTVMPSYSSLHILGNGRFSDWGVNDSLGAEAVNEAVSDFERAAVNSNVLAQAKNRGIAFHFFPDSLTDGFEISELRHVEFDTRELASLILFDFTAIRITLATTSADRWPPRAASGLNSNPDSFRS